ncbi:hypothetical protein GLI01_01540 [Gluconacetobacter liquefaciens]|uniref:Uncharacterized protein n=1 Tax=Gluconacetobacter liquefaciens TaxID=89584 RepID=A0A370G934_GLULI|nr:hypothetical protein C7453_102268 [Gluconacetobacter liquefaciens]GBQ97201.1 hypothetical protein AA0522_0921 [Gluconacetobacter liquefaciens NRIC 0522]GEB36119.1 hypothetical protein GLI01_01540 [Gluconacetobacter liquefaciens]
MPAPPSKPWFAAKRYGVGSGLPIAWQGWVVMLGGFAVLSGVSALSLFLHSASMVFIEILVDSVVLVVILVICAAKTEGGWRWRWGGQDT